MIISLVGIAIIVIFVVLLFILVKEVYFIHKLKECGHICCKCEYAEDCHCDKPTDPDGYLYRETIDKDEDMYM